MALAEEVLLSCSNGASGRGVRITAWEPSKGTVKRTYSCDAQGGGAALALLGSSYLLCALKSLPFIYAWHLRKVIAGSHDTTHVTYQYAYAGTSAHEDGMSWGGTDSGHYT